jgi:SAM-dependent methyltransferase
VTTAEQERAKYLRAWQTPAYQNHSPGEAVAPLALQWALELGATSLADYGCGDGKAMRIFSRRIPRVVGLDIVGPQAGAEGDVWATALWALPDNFPVTDFAFSSDTLEHLPPGKVDAALERIARHTMLGGFFQVSTRTDSTGKELGETLHLTVEATDWWRRKIEAHFRLIGEGGDDASPQFWVAL